MSKTLTKIFDKANANEIENLLNQNTPMEVSADTLSSIKSKVYAKTGIPNMKKKKPIHSRWKSYSAAAACLLLIVGGIFASPSIMKYFNIVMPQDIVGQVLPTDIDKIIWAGNEQSDIDTDNVDAFVNWNGWSMDYELYEALNSAGESDFIAVLVKKNGIDIGSFEYNGKKLYQLESEYNKISSLESKLLGFHKEGELLKYGEALYTTGTPDGERWSKELYDDVVSFYGEEFIAKYIVKGEVQTDLLNEDLNNCVKLGAEIYKEISELREAYHESYVDDVEEIFLRSGVCAIARERSVFLFVQRDELAELKIDGKENYLLSLAERFEFDSSSTNIPDDTIDDTVTGFVIEKLHFEGVSMEAKTDQEVTAAISALANNEFLQFIIYSETHISNEELEDMRYTRVDYWNYPTRTVVTVRNEKLNMEAIKELSNRIDITSIHISPLIEDTSDDVIDVPSAEG